MDVTFEPVEDMCSVGMALPLARSARKTTFLVGVGCKDGIDPFIPSLYKSVQSLICFIGLLAFPRFNADHGVGSRSEPVGVAIENSFLVGAPQEIGGQAFQEIGVDFGESFFGEQMSAAFSQIVQFLK